MVAHEGNNANELVEILKNNAAIAFASRGKTILAFASHPPFNENNEFTVTQYTFSLGDAKSLQVQLQNLIDTVQQRRANNN